MSSLSHAGFELVRPLGRGGMGEVWLARHRASQTDVAVKLITGKLAQDHGFRRVFHQEVRAVAGLDHPNIVRVLDYGALGTEDLAAGDEALEAGAPWLAMELAAGGSLEQRPLPTSWTELCEVLVPVLNALGHAHARGIVHRDLKPANILVAGDDATGSGLARLVLTDFGIAHVSDPEFTEAQDDHGTPAVMAGTPAYMAPEQLQGHWRDFGPWTDLYALGCMAYELVCGNPPYRAASVPELAMAHLQSPIPPLAPCFAVPEAFEGWLAQLLHKDFTRRFQRAADAAQELAALHARADWTSPVAQRHVTREARDPTWSTWNDATVDMATGLASALASPLLGLTVVDGHTLESSPLLTPILTSTGIGETAWPLRIQTRISAATLARAGETTPFRGVALTGVGLGLFGLREIPLLDRERERETLYEAFSRTCESGHPRAVLLSGAAGSGKSRLVEWVTRRMHELGAATILRGSHSPIDGAGDGLPALFTHFYATQGLRGSALYERLVFRMRRLQGPLDSPAEAVACASQLAALLGPAPSASADEEAPAQTPQVRFGSHEERHAAIVQQLRLLCRERPVVLWLDNLHFGHDALGFVRHLVGRPHEGLPVLVLGTLRPEALQRRPLEREYARMLGTLERVQTLEVAPLAAEHQRALVDALLPLAPQLADEVATRTADSPQFAVDMVSELVARAELAPGPQGFARQAHRPLPLCTTMAEMSAARIDGITRAFANPLAALKALEAAAVLGAEVHPQEWRAVCEALGTPIPEGLVDQLVRRGLARTATLRQGQYLAWYFTQEAARECLETSAHQAARLPAIHLACARIIQSGALNGSGLAERRAHHLIAAGEDAEAREPLLEALDARLRDSAYPEALALMDTHEELCQRLGWPAHDPRRVVLGPKRARIYRFTARNDEARDLSRAIVAIPSLPDAIRAEALLVSAGIEMMQGFNERAVACSEESIALYERLGDMDGMGRALHSRGWLHVQSRQMPEAIATFGKALGCAQHTGNRTEEAWYLHGIAEARLRAGIAEGIAEARQGVATFEAVGNRVGMGACLRVEGDFLAQDGHFAQAREALERSRQICLAAQSMHAWTTVIAQSFALLMQGELSGAREHLDFLAPRVHSSVQPAYRLSYWLARAALEAGSGEEEATLAACNEVLEHAARAWLTHPAHPLLIARGREWSAPCGPAVQQVWNEVDRALAYGA